MNKQVRKLLIVFLVLLLVTLFNSCKGKDGKDGQNGPAGLNGQDGSDANLPDSAIVGLRAPCAQNPNDESAPEINDFRYEVLLKAKDGRLFASASNNTHGDYTRLSHVPVGTYYSTGAVNCMFTVNADNSITRN